MKLLLVPLAVLLSINVFLWWPHSVIVSLCWAVALISSPKLLED